MPADSDPSGVAVPHTWRPLGVRLALWLVGGLLIVLLVAVWILIGPDVRSQFTPYQRVTLVIIGLLLFVITLVINAISISFVRRFRQAY